MTEVVSVLVFNKNCQYFAMSKTRMVTQMQSQGNEILFVKANKLYFKGNDENAPFIISLLKEYIILP